MNLKSILLILIVLIFSACSSTHFSVLSTKPINQKKLSFEKVKTNVEGVSVQRYLFGIPLSDNESSYQSAVEDALGKSKTDILSDAVVKKKTFSLTLPLGQYGHLHIYRQETFSVVGNGWVVNN